MLLHPASTLQRAISCAVAFCAASSCAVAEVNIVFFETRIRPLFANHCYECHSADAKKLKGGLRLDTRESILRGGETGAILAPGKPEESTLITAVKYADKDLQMPPPKDELSRKLSELQINDLTEWVRFGAPMPADTDASRRASADEARAHWAFRAPVEPPLPAVHNKSWIKTDIDRFVLAELEKAGLRPAPPADPRSLIRRMSFDLTGLPPTSAEVQTFVGQAERDPESAIRELIERLLASPRYGERWGRHWLDLARYADTKGYVYGREERFFVHAHAYRDWVIRAFNEDLPFDRFLLLQIAAEQLVPPESPDLAAMGFLTGGRRFIGVTHDIIDDRIDVVTRGAMGLTVQCARCHDHKYDPIPARDYYALYGVFHNAVERLVRIKGRASAVAEGAAYEKEQQTHEKKFADTMRKRRDEASARLRKRVGEYLAAQLELHKYPEEGFDQILTADDLIPASVRRWRDFLQQSEAGSDPIFLPWHRLGKIASERFEVAAREEVVRLKRNDGGAINPHVLVMLEPPPVTMRELAQRYGELFARIDQRAQQPLDAENNDTSASKPLADPAETALRKFLYDSHAPTTVPDVGIVNNELFFPTSVCEELWKLQGEVDRWIIKSPQAPTYALILADGDPEPNPRVLRRGNPARRGEEVTRRFLSIIAGPDAAPFQNGSGRLELARAIVDPKNPLPARVMANRIWLHHFGSGLVRTPSDFGLRAEPPSHPELLDWLALRFIAGKWSVKQMHRSILSSAVYQQASNMVANRGSQVADSPNGASTGLNSQATDPENQRLSRFNRRRLDFEQFRDALLAVSGELDLTMGGKPLELLAADNKRRTVYSLVDRQFLPGTFRVFDFANPDLHIAQRHATVVPQQALFFLNNDFVATRARALAQRPEIVGTNSTEERVHHLMEQVFQRRATAGEIAAAEALIAEAQSEIPPPPPRIVESAWQYGWGDYDEAKKRVRTFKALPHFTGNAWQGGPGWPDAKLGWLQLTAEGGHPGNDLQHAVIRRWVAPRDATVAIAGSISHEPQEGDGIHAFIVHSRHGELHSSIVHHRTEEIMIPAVETKKGETVDFVVHIQGGLNSDQFKWTPLITVMESAVASDVPGSWNAKTEFAGPRPLPQIAPLTPWEQYAQVLLLSNEFAFVD